MATLTIKQEEKDFNKTKYLFKNTAIFAIGSVATKIITFLLIPLYTHELDTTEYGIADLLFAICSFLYPLFTLNIAEAIFRFSMDKNADIHKITKIGTICFLVSAVLGVPASLLLKPNPDTESLVLFFYFYLTSSSASQILLAFMKGQENLRVFTAGNIINTFLTAIFAILFLATFNMGLGGYFLAYIISNVITTVYILVRGNVLRSRNTKLDKKLFYQMAKYSTVLIPTTFMWWIINSSDKIMITNSISAAANGIYAISYKIPSFLTVIASIFNQAWVFSAVKQKDMKDNEEYTNAVFDTLLNVIFIAAIILLVFIKPLIQVIVAPEYYEAWQYTPFLIFGFIFLTMSTFISSSYNAHKDSKGLLFSGLTGAIANIVLNAILIPPMGMYGAATATAISYIVVFIYRYYDTKKYVKIHLKLRYLASLLLLLVACLTVFIPSGVAIPLQVVEVLAAFALSFRTIKNLLKILKDTLFKGTKTNHS